jgi:hypothetical protein
MGDTLWIEVRDTRTSPGPGDDNSIMLKLQGRLDRLCERLGVSKLSEFVDDSQAAAECLKWLRQDAESGLLPGVNLTEPDPATFEPRWFDPGPALTAVRALLAHLERSFGDLGFRPNPSRAHWPELLMDELRGCESALAEAVAHGQQFRFLLVS